MKNKQKQFIHNIPAMLRDATAEKAMHGVLCACSSPQYADRLADEANRLHKGYIPDAIASRAYAIADALIQHGNKKT